MELARSRKGENDMDPAGSMKGHERRAIEAEMVGGEFVGGVSPPLASSAWEGYMMVAVAWGIPWSSRGSRRVYGRPRSLVGARAAFSSGSTDGASRGDAMAWIQ